LFILGCPNCSLSRNIILAKQVNKHNANSTCSAIT
jgi:hypothetical protein